MINLGKHELNQKCPNCGKHLKITINDVMKQKKVVCSCGQEIQLVDSKGSVKEASIKVNKALDEVLKAFKKIGK